MDFLTEPEPQWGMPHAVAPGIHRIVAPNPGAMTYWGTNTYLIDGPGGVVVLDPGPDDPRHVGAIVAAAGAHVAAILLSHTHHDHLGATAALRQATGAPVAAWHDPAVPSFAPDIRLQDGDLAGAPGSGAWRALHTPGHAPDHLCFAGPDGVLFSADHVMGWSSSVVGPPGGNMGLYFRSLERLTARDDTLYLPGHGPPLQDPAPFVRSLLAHRQGREAAILAALDATPKSSQALVAVLYRGLDPSLARAAERNVTAHLHKLAEDKLARGTGEGWTRG